MVYPLAELVKIALSFSVEIGLLLPVSTIITSTSTIKTQDNSLIIIYSNKEDDISDYN
jgi:hypothetical protein